MSIIMHLSGGFTTDFVFNVFCLQYVFCKTHREKVNDFKLEFLDIQKPQTNLKRLQTPLSFTEARSLVA